MPQSLIDVAKASIQAYNEKDWDGIGRVITTDMEYDEVATNRRLKAPPR